MTGSLLSSHYEAVKEEYESDQRSLSDFCESGSRPTKIAVVSKPGDLTDYCDEWMPHLGMPEKYLKRYGQYLAGYKTNSAVDDPYTRAWNDAQLEKEYMRHVRTSDEAQKAISGIVSRLRDGEDITLVCFEEPSQPCHRHLLIEMIEARLSSEFFSEKRDSTLTA
jgi:hypothetical protein